MKMADMKLTPAERLSDAPMAAPSGPEYPYGLCLRLSENEIAKLGLEEDPPEVGAVVPIQALGRVTMVREDESGCCVEIQITKLGIGAPSASAAAKTLYGKEEAKEGEG